MIDFKEFAEEQDWALPRIKENFGVPRYDMEIVNKFLKK